MTSRIDAHVASMWPELEPFDVPTELPKLDAAHLPPWMREMVTAVTIATGFDVSMAVGYALGALSCAAQGRLDVRITSSWSEQCCLYIAIVADPGEGKSPVYKPLIGPLHDLDKELAEEAAPRVRAALREREAVEKRLKGAVDQLAKAKSSQEETAARADILECEETLAKTADAIPQLIADDITAETMGVKLQEQGERLAIMSAEDSTFGHNAGRYHRAAPPVEILLKAFGGESVRVDRFSRVVAMSKPCLTICTAMQPSVMTGKGVELAEGRGLLARFLFVRPPRRTGYRDVSKLPSAIPEAIASLYRTKLQALTRAMRSRPSTIPVSLSDEATSVFLAWRSSVEPRRRDGADLATIREWSAKAEGQVLRIAALLWLGDSVDPELQGSVTGSVSASHVERASALWSSLAVHALDALGVSTANATVKSAHALMQWARRNDVDVFTQREVSRGPGKAKGFLVVEAIRELERRGMVRKLPTNDKGRPSLRYEIRPSVVLSPLAPVS